MNTQISSEAMNKENECFMNIFTSTEFAEEDKLLFIRNFIECGQNLNISGQEWKTPLHLAVKHCSPKMVELLLSNNAHPNSLDHHAVSPMMLVARRKTDHMRVLDLLFTYGADPRVVDIHGYNAAVWAIMYDQPEMLKEMLKYTPVNFRLLNGDNLMHTAVKCKSIKCVQVLLNFSLDEKEVDKNGLTALEIAQRYKMTFIISLLFKDNTDTTSTHLQIEDDDSSGSDTHVSCSVTLNSYKVDTDFLE